MEREDEFRGEGTFKAFASIIAANHIIDQLRRESKRVEVEGLWASDQYAIDQDRLQRWIASDRTAPHPIEGNSTDLRFQNTSVRLNGKDRT